MEEIKEIMKYIHDRFWNLPDGVKQYTKDQYNEYMRAYMRNVYRKTHHRVTVTLSPDEYQQLQQEAKHSQRKLATFTRETVLASVNHTSILPKNIEHTLHEVTLQIRHIGNNLNQIAHHVNTHQRVEKADIQRSFALLKQLETHIINSVRTPAKI